MNLKVTYCTKQVEVTGSLWGNGGPSALFQSRVQGLPGVHGGRKQGAGWQDSCVVGPRSQMGTCYLRPGLDLGPLGPRHLFAV